MSHNVYAYTAPGSNYPEYISVNVEDDGVVSLTVRGPVWGDGTCGDTATIPLSATQLRDLARTLFSYACTGNA